VLAAVQLPPISIVHHPEQHLDPDKNGRGSGERREQRGLGQLLARWQPRELSLNDFQLNLDRGEVGSRLIGLAHLEGECSCDINTLYKNMVAQGL
jgi:hypothetical protein